MQQLTVLKRSALGPQGSDIDDKPPPTEIRTGMDGIICDGGTECEGTMFRGEFRAAAVSFRRQ
ncbi:hypothetical protein MPC4_110110 [Methylocella tundrae]|uniref:Uncharacterized protein n=1 Tax=Methylocella tundrae TaxID=227605 RepID=A0A8B6M3G6_METTU|nr:hypothetical protein MPC4_110110 [Methylocella tundrae]